MSKITVLQSYIQEKYAFVDRSLAIALGVGVSGLIAMVALIPIRFSGGQNSLIVFYSVNNALIQEGTLGTLFRIPLIGLVLLSVNLVFAALIGKTNKYFAQALLYIASAAQIALLIAVIALDRINV